LTAAEAAIALDGTSAEAWLYVGAAQQELGRARDARAAYEKYLALAPKGGHAGEIRSVLRSLH
jgi:Flp pilus assembly protein TadD